MRLFFLVTSAITMLTIGGCWNSEISANESFNTRQEIQKDSIFYHHLHNVIKSLDKDISNDALSESIYVLSALTKVDACGPHGTIGFMFACSEDVVIWNTWYLKNKKSVTVEQLIAN